MATSLFFCYHQLYAPFPLPLHPSPPLPFFPFCQAIVLTTSEKKSNASIAVYLVSNGADLNVKNTKNQCPLDLCSDPNLIKHLTRLKEEAGTRRNSQDLCRVYQERDGCGVTDCMQCVTNKRDALLVPCGHVTSCVRCASKMKKCLLCGEGVEKFTPVRPE